MKGINQNTRPRSQPADSYRYGKNGLSNVRLGSIENEPGFAAMAATLPYRYIGSIPTDKYPVVFSTNNVHSAIGYFNTDTEQYQPIIDDASLGFKIGLNSDYYVIGEAQRNHKGEVVIAFTDKHKVCGYLNCDVPDVSTIADMSLFPVVHAPTMVISQDTGGALYPGAYFATMRYVKNDGTQTGFVGNTGITIVLNTAGTGQVDRTLMIKVSNIDTSYDYIEMAIVSNISGTYGTPQLLQAVPIIGDTMTIPYSGTEVTTDLALENILIPPAYYTRVGTMGQLNDKLYIGDLDSEPEVDMQKWVNLLTVQWKSELMNVNNPLPEHTRGEKRSLMHEETIAIYIQYAKTSGGWTKWFTVPGKAPFPADLLPSSRTSLHGIDAKVFQVDDTVRTFDLATMTGDMGIWINQNEFYPNHPSFDSTGVGGEDLRGQPVRHHRTPSLTWCKTNLYSTDPSYGKDSLDLLGLIINNVIIPSQYIGSLTGEWRIGIGKRTINNTSVLGQSLLLHGARKANIHEVGGGVHHYELIGGDDFYISTGGNFNSNRWRTGHIMDKGVGCDPTIIRFHAFDMLFSQPAITPSYLSTHMKLKRSNLQADQAMIENFDLGSGIKGPIVYLLDYLGRGEVPVLAAPDQRFRKVSDGNYRQVNLPDGKWYNVDLETAYGAKIDAPIMGIDTDFDDQEVRVTDTGQDNEYSIQWETTYLSNLMALREEMFTPYTTQKVIQDSHTFTGGSGTTFCGDTFIVPYTFHTYGWWTQENEKFNDTSGTKVVRRFVCESAANLYGRYETAGNIYARYYPKSNLQWNQPHGSVNNYITQFIIKYDPNQFGYNRTLNALNELTVDVGIHNTQADINIYHPFRIHRGGMIGRQDKTKSWRTFAPLDYYEVKKTMGKIVNIDGQDDRLLIHCMKALMVTQDKAKLETDVLRITLGAGDIFQFDPLDALSDPMGSVGTQHDLSCLRTAFGYFGVDASMGQAFMYKQDPENVGRGLYNLFLKILKVLPTNVYQGDGITVGYDPQYKRILLTVKNSNITKTIKYGLTDADIPSLVPGDYVFMNNRVMEFLGPNTPSSSGVTCAPSHIPIVEDQVFTLASGYYDHVEITVLGGIFVQSVAMLSVVPFTSVFIVDPVTNKLYVNGWLNGTVIPSWTLHMRATSDTLDTADFTIVINVNP